MTDPNDAPAPGATPPATPPPTPPPSADPPPPPELGDAGTKALSEERAARKAAEKAAREAQTEIDKLKNAQLPDQEKAVAEARSAARAEALDEVNGRLFAAMAKAEAAKARVVDPDLFADAEVAAALLGFDELPTTPKGDLDAEAISAAVTDLVAKRPYLVAPTGAPLDLGQGARGAAPAPADMNAAIRTAAGRR